LEVLAFASGCVWPVCWRQYKDVQQVDESVFLITMVYFFFSLLLWNYFLLILHIFHQYNKKNVFKNSTHWF
jgi:hypothetical protein